MNGKKSKKNQKVNIKYMKINQELRAYYSWKILVECAKNKKTITYKDFSNEIKIHHRTVRYPLEYIQDYCLKNQLPPLSILVVNKTTGLPGTGFKAWEIEDSEKGIKIVFDFDWTKLLNPFSYAENGTTENDLVKKILKNPENSGEVYSLIKNRGVSQSIFRSILLKTYNSRCAFCGFSHEEALEASHIIPYCDSSDSQKIDPRNGLLLCSIHHKLFDYGLISINQDYTISILENQNIDKEIEYNRIMTTELDGKKIYLPKDKMFHPEISYLVNSKDKNNKKS